MQTLDIQLDLPFVLIYAANSREFWDRCENQKQNKVLEKVEVVVDKVVDTAKLVVSDSAVSNATSLLDRFRALSDRMSASFPWLALVFRFIFAAYDLYKLATDKKEHAVIKYGQVASIVIGIAFYLALAILAALAVTSVGVLMIVSSCYGVGDSLFKMAMSGVKLAGFFLTQEEKAMRKNDQIEGTNQFANKCFKDFGEAGHNVVISCVAVVASVIFCVNQLVGGAILVGLFGYGALDLVGLNPVRWIGSKVADWMLPPKLTSPAKNQMQSAPAKPLAAKKVEQVTAEKTADKASKPALDLKQQAHHSSEAGLYSQMHVDTSTLKASIKVGELPLEVELPEAEVPKPITPVADKQGELQDVSTAEKQKAPASTAEEEKPAPSPRMHR